MQSLQRTTTGREQRQGLRHLGQEVADGLKRSGAPLLIRELGGCAFLQKGKGRHQRMSRCVTFSATADQLLLQLRLLQEGDCDAPRPVSRWV